MTVTLSPERRSFAIQCVRDHSSLGDSFSCLHRRCGAAGLSFPRQSGSTIQAVAAFASVFSQAAENRFELAVADIFIANGFCPLRGRGGSIPQFAGYKQ